MVDENSATASCSRASCPNEAAFTCAYVDRRRHACATAWCPNHGVDIKGIHYCPRHASTVISVGEEAIAAGHLPELENRVPSLVYWVGRDLDSDVPVILATVINETDNESLMVDPVALVAGGGRQDVRRWERNWKVVSHTGISQRVTPAGARGRAGGHRAPGRPGRSASREAPLDHRTRGERGPRGRRGEQRTACLLPPPDRRHHACSRRAEGAALLGHGARGGGGAPTCAHGRVPPTPRQPPRHSVPRDDRCTHGTPRAARRSCGNRVSEPSIPASPRTPAHSA